jgi:hypothetical protein
MRLSHTNHNIKTKKNPQQQNEVSIHRPRNKQNRTFEAEERIVQEAQSTQAVIQTDGNHAMHTRVLDDAAKHWL